MASGEPAGRRVRAVRRTEPPTAGMVEIRHVPGGTGRAYDQIYAGSPLRQHSRDWSWLVDLLDAVAGMRVLDVACGEGQFLAAAAKRGLEAHGVELSPVAARKAASAGVLSVVADGEALPYPAASFDRVVSFGSLEHYERPERGAQEIARVLAPDGLALFQLPNTFGLRWSVLHAWRTGEVHDDGQPIQRYGTRGQWSRLLSQAGLQVEAVRGYEDSEAVAGTPGGLAGMLAHPSRGLALVADRLPSDMASMFLFLCRRSAGAGGVSTHRNR